MQILWTVKKTEHQYNQNTWVQNVVKRNRFLFKEVKKQNRSSIISGWEGDWLIQEGTSYPAKITHNFLQAEKYSIINQHKLFLETTNIWAAQKDRKMSQKFKKFYWYHNNSTQEK